MRPAPTWPCATARYPRRAFFFLAPEAPSIDVTSPPALLNKKVSFLRSQPMTLRPPTPVASLLEDDRD